jgi:phytoene synthase
VPESPPGAAGGGALGAAGAPNALTPARYLAWLYSPPSQQPVFAALCEIESEVAASLRPGIDHHVAHARLQWWREESERSARGEPVHPLTRELLRAYGSGGTQAASPDVSGFVDTAIWDLASATFETRRELTAYCERWATAMFEPAAGIAAPSHWRMLGAAVREIELLATSLAPDAHAGRLRAPLEELERAGVDPKSLAKPPWPAALAALLRERHAALRGAVANAVAGVEREAQASARGLMVWAALAWRMSLRAQSALPGMIAPRRYHAFADGWQAWRAARRATAGTLRLD